MAAERRIEAVVSELKAAQLEEIRRLEALHQRSENHWMGVIDAERSGREERDKEVEQLRGEVRKLETALADAEKQSARADAQLHAATDRADALAAQLEAERGRSREAVDAARQELAESRESVAELRQALASSQSQLDQANSRADANQQALLEMAGKLAERSGPLEKQN
jgi:GTPase involved in cell partitioning and DNA repair